MRNNEIIFVDDLVDAIREKRSAETYSEGDPGHTTYSVCNCQKSGKAVKWK